MTGNIKANILTRIAFRVPSSFDSKTILDYSGAEKLLIHGDAIMKEGGNRNNIRIQTPFISDGEIKKVVESLSKL